MSQAELRPLTIGEILDNGFGLYRKHFATLAIVVLVVSAAPAVLALYVQASGGPLVRPVLWVGTHLLNTVLSAIGTAATFFIVSDSYLGRPASAWDALARAVPFIMRLVVLQILVVLTLVLGLFLFLFPAILFLAAFLVSTQSLVLEDRGPIEAMGRSWHLTKGHRMKVLAVFGVTWIIAYIPSIASVMVAATLIPSIDPLSASPDLPIAWYVSMVTGAILQLLLYPLMYSVVTVTYYDLRVRKEGFDLEVLAQALEPQ